MRGASPRIFVCNSTTLPPVNEKHSYVNRLRWLTWGDLPTDSQGFFPGVANLRAAPFGNLFNLAHHRLPRIADNGAW